MSVDYSSEPFLTSLVKGRTYIFGDTLERDWGPHSSVLKTPHDAENMLRLETSSVFVVHDGLEMFLPDVECVIDCAKISSSCTVLRLSKCLGTFMCLYEQQPQTAPVFTTQNAVRALCHAATHISVNIGDLITDTTLVDWRDCVREALGRTLLSTVGISATSTLSGNLVARGTLEPRLAQLLDVTVRKFGHWGVLLVAILKSKVVVKSGDVVDYLATMAPWTHHHVSHIYTGLLSCLGMEPTMPSLPPSKKALRDVISRTMKDAHCVHVAKHYYLLQATGNIIVGKSHFPKMLYAMCIEGGIIKTYVYSTTQEQPAVMTITDVTLPDKMSGYVSQSVLGEHGMVLIRKQPFRVCCLASHETRVRAYLAQLRASLLQVHVAHLPCQCIFYNLSVSPCRSL